ncbi:hypothetical protein NM208_g8824 [Fusarium decemcellulare]|uniref:Uncharacterized protein n=1 Tax=Fusarium decemcellulare TaxID=57161 RepID=A0ACC1S400_9HYPO|nr:hypothetical protein NM208_g8824 [Fusarium decemcellulare]
MSSNHYLGGRGRGGGRGDSDAHLPEQTRLAAPTLSGQQNVPREPDLGSRNQGKCCAEEAAVAEGGDKLSKLDSTASAKPNVANTSDVETTGVAPAHQDQSSVPGNDARVCGNCKKPGHVVSRCWTIQASGYINGCAICNRGHNTKKCKQFPKDKPSQVDLLVFQRANLPPLANSHWFGLMLHHMERHPTTKVQGLPWSVEFCQELREDQARVDQLALNLSESGSADGRECDPDTKSWEAAKAYCARKQEDSRQSKDSTQPQGSTAPKQLTRAEKRAAGEEDMITMEQIVAGSIAHMRKRHEIDFDSSEDSSEDTSKGPGQSKDTRKSRDSAQPQGSTAPKPLTKAQKRALAEEDMFTLDDIQTDGMDAIREDVDYVIDWSDES